jgi:hypothetical protein
MYAICLPRKQKFDHQRKFSPSTPLSKKSAFAPEIVLTSTREIAEIPLPGIPKERLAIVLFGVWKARSL